jgi:proteasome activator subunit 4
MPDELDVPEVSDLTRSSTPAALWRQENTSANGSGYTEEGDVKENDSRSRPRTFPYFEHLPYDAETENDRLANLNICLNQLYMAVSSGDFNPGVVHWTREIRGWLGLKFDMPRDIRVKLIHLYYRLALAPGLDNSLCERFASMFMSLTK